VAQVPGTYSANIHLITFAHIPDLVKLHEASFTSKCVSCIQISTYSCFDKTFTTLQRTSAPCKHQQNLAKHNVGSVRDGTCTAMAFDIGVMSCITAAIAFQ
jgi:hypothetical protein